MKQYSLREIILVMVIVSLLFGWWIDRQNREPSVGRFTGFEDPVGRSAILDTATGQVWHGGTSEFYKQKNQ